MDYYFKTLLIVIPVFIILIIIEQIVAKVKGVQVNRAPDVIASQSSGISNVVFDTVKFGITIISYSWLVDNIALINIKLNWVSFIIAFFIIDFAGYWDHRFSHRINILWNRHYIHHSSEDFNLSCALRQSISNFIRFSAIFMIPAAIVGIPASVFAILGPVHLFLQFWYHTRLIDKLGILEKVIVTPSHHRVHHAINPEYIDKNYSQIFIFWDKIFGTFQSEINTIKPIYGTLKPAKTWNPILINFKHLKHLILDSIRANNLKDKLKIWFMPTGWRPLELSRKFPHKKRDQKKYETRISTFFAVWSFFQLLLALIFLFHFLYVAPETDQILIFYYSGFLITHIFSMTSALDLKVYSIYVEILKGVMWLILLSINESTWFNIDQSYNYLFIVYFIISIPLSIFFYFKESPKGHQSYHFNLGNKGS